MRAAARSFGSLQGEIFFNSEYSSCNKESYHQCLKSIAAAVGAGAGCRTCQTSDGSTARRGSRCVAGATGRARPAPASSWARLAGARATPPCSPGRTTPPGWQVGYTSGLGCNTTWYRWRGDAGGGAGQQLHHHRAAPARPAQPAGLLSRAAKLGRLRHTGPGHQQSGNSWGAACVTCCVGRY